MVSFHASFLKKDGKNEFVVISYDEFLKLQEELDDYESLKELRDAKSHEASCESIPFSDVKKKFGLEN